MSKDQNAKLQGTLSNRGTELTAFQMFQDSMRAWWSGNGKRVSALCGSDDMARKLFVTAVNVVQKTPKLIECDFNSFISCLLTSAELNLFPGAKQECAYVPLNNRRTDKLEANFWPMYQGIVKHAVCKAISCNVVYQADEFDYNEGTRPFIHHKTFLGDREDRGPRKCFYCGILTTEGEWQIKVVPLSFVEGIKKNSLGSKSSDSPWNTGEDNYDAMGRKTAFKQAAKWIPKNDSLARVIDIDNQIERPDLSKPNILDMSSLMNIVNDPFKKAIPESTGQQVDLSGVNRPKETVSAAGRSEQDKALYGDR